MSSPFSSFGGAPTSLCQRCRSPLSPNIVQCGYCGYDNSPVQHNDLVGHVPPSSPQSFPASSQLSSTPNHFFQPESQTSSSSQWHPSSFDNSFPSAQPTG